MKVWTIAVYTFREAARGRVALVTFLFSVLVVHALPQPSLHTTSALSPSASHPGNSLKPAF